MSAKALAQKILAVLGAKDLLSEDTLKKALSKVDPRLKSLFSNASKYGFPIGATLGFLKSFAQTGRLPQDASQRPSQLAAENIERQAEAPAQLGRAALSTGIGALTGGAAGAGIGTLLDKLGTPSQEQQPEQVPPQASIKKPSFAEREMANVEAQQAARQVPQQQMAQGEQGFQMLLDQFPQLGRFIEDKLNKGLSIPEVVKVTRNNKLYAPLVRNLEERMGRSLEELIPELFARQLQSLEKKQASSNSKTLENLIQAYHRARGG